MSTDDWPDGPGADAGGSADGERGHRSLPHTADVRIEAWAPTREECVAQAVLGLVESFADLATAKPARSVTVSVEEGTAQDVLLAVLDEVVYRLDAFDEVPVDAEVEAVDGGLELRLAVTGTDAVEIVGAAPKGVALHGLRIGAEGPRWSCAVTVDV
ncbi:archease [Allostreptomyces psammosilenae]|uniref:SHS2 domain-containing protein n=1 Tax=Allostreptomyces psammosilenae TaxID=1892865 RepID=A0A852ZML1_9ACTN|nr:archease [Allostreptomyces psammosilenae]NYI03653.1 SHS2 domain-containing protein [Allostreptomyces psammosilenae]